MQHVAEQQTRRRSPRDAAGAVAAALGLAACGSSGGSSRSRPAPSRRSCSPSRAWAPRARQTQTAINAFEKANPNIKVKIDVLSSDSTTYLSQLENSFIAGSPTPDVFESDVTYPAKFAQAGWVLNLSQPAPGHEPVLPDRGRGGHVQRQRRTRCRGSTTPRACTTGPT